MVRIRVRRVNLRFERAKPGLLDRAGRPAFGLLLEFALLSKKGAQAEWLPYLAKL